MESKMANNEVMAAISAALHMYMNQNAQVADQGTAKGGNFVSPWTFKSFVMRPQPIKTSYLKPIKK